MGTDAVAATWPRHKLFNIKAWLSPRSGDPPKKTSVIHKARRLFALLVGIALGIVGGILFAPTKGVNAVPVP